MNIIFFQNIKTLIYLQKRMRSYFEKSMVLYETGGNLNFVLNQDYAPYLLQTSSNHTLPAMNTRNGYNTLRTKPSLITTTIVT